MSFDAFFENLDKPIVPLKTSKNASKNLTQKTDTANLAQLWGDRPSKKPSPFGVKYLGKPTTEIA